MDTTKYRLTTISTPNGNKLVRAFTPEYREELKAEHRAAVKRGDFRTARRVLAALIQGWMLPRWRDVH